MNKQGWPNTDAVNPEIYKDRNEWPKISIVTPSYNQGQFIEETILSILNQNYPNLEYIIIDGGSTDNTVEIIKKYEDRITFWVSEPDRGQAHAINKGFEKCTGEIFNWINSDDYLENKALFAISMAYQKNYSIAAPIYTFNDFSKSIIANEKLNYEDYLLLKDVYNQPGFWFNLKRVKEIGILDTNYHYAFDRIYMINFLKNYNYITYISSPVAYFREHEQSKTVSSWYKFYEELLKYYKHLTLELQYPLLNSIINKYYLPQYIVSLVFYNHKTAFKRFVYLVCYIMKKPKLLRSRYYIGAIKNSLLNE